MSEGEKQSNRGKITVAFGEIVFSSDFDSGNLDRVEECKSTVVGTHEYNLWTAPDCAGLPHENGCKTWFYFSVATPANSTGTTLRFNIQNLNKQCRLYQQGLTPIVKTVPGRGGWERMRERPEYEVTEEGRFKLSFQTTIADSRKQTSYFAFCFPYSYSECQRLLSKLDDLHGVTDRIPHTEYQEDDIYYHRELLCHSLDGRRVDLITVSSYTGIIADREPRLEGLFPDTSKERAHSFKGKKVIFVSSRVHPGETPASHVFNGFLHFILRKDDLRAGTLRKHFVFKLIPMLNPDGVYRGHYRMDTLGVNLNRMYLTPTLESYPSIFAARSLVLHYHHKYAVSPHIDCDTSTPQAHTTVHVVNASHQSGIDHNDVPMSICGKENTAKQENRFEGITSLSTSSIACSNPVGVENSPSNAMETPFLPVQSSLSERSSLTQSSNVNTSTKSLGCNEVRGDEVCSNSVDAIAVTRNSGIAFYVDLHAHATKRGCFIYGNYFNDIVEQTENMLFPKLVSLNSPHLDFDHCVFSEKNMYASDKRDGMSKEGSGRVGIYKATGIIHSYTLECNYNSGRQCNTLGAATLDDGRATPPNPGSPMPHRFSIQDYEQVGHALAVAALDYYQINPWSRLPNTEYKSLVGVRESLMTRITNTRTKRGDLTTFTKHGVSAPEEVASADPAPTRNTTQSSRMLLKRQKTVEIARGPRHIAFDISFVTDSKRAGKRRYTARSGSTSAKLRSKVVGQNGCQTKVLKQLEQSNGLTTCNVVKPSVKPSVKDVVFPKQSLEVNESSVYTTKPRIVFNKEKTSLEVNTSKTVHLSLSAPSRARPVLRFRQRAKTLPLPEIGLRSLRPNLAELSDTTAKPCGLIQGQISPIGYPTQLSFTVHRKKVLVDRRQRMLKRRFKNDVSDCANGVDRPQ